MIICYIYMVYMGEGGVNPYNHPVYTPLSLDTLLQKKKKTTNWLIIYSSKDRFSFEKIS